MGEICCFSMVAFVIMSTFVGKDPRRIVKIYGGICGLLLLMSFSMAIFDIRADSAAVNTDQNPTVRENPASYRPIALFTGYRRPLYSSGGYRNGK